MVLVAFCLGSAVLGVLLQVYFRRFSWSYLFLSIALSAAGFEGTPFALGEISPSFSLFDFMVPLMVYDLVPWFIFAFLPLQIGYFGAMLARTI